MTTANYGWLVFHVEIHLTKKLKKKNKFKIDSLRQKWFNDLYIRMRRVIRYLHAYIERTSILINMIIYQLLCVFFFLFLLRCSLSLSHSLFYTLSKFSFNICRVSVALLHFSICQQTFHSNWFHDIDLLCDRFEFEMYECVSK